MDYIFWLIILLIFLLVALLVGGFLSILLVDLEATKSYELEDSDT